MPASYLGQDRVVLSEVPVGYPLLLSHCEDGGFVPRQSHRVNPSHSLRVVRHLVGVRIARSPLENEHVLLQGCFFVVLALPPPTGSRQNACQWPLSLEEPGEELRDQRLQTRPRSGTKRAL